MRTADAACVSNLVPSPNHGARAKELKPDCLILHYTGMATGDAAVARLCDPAAEVSCHYVVMEDGRVLQLVAEDRRAWHAGQSQWAGESDLNSRSIGLEIVNPGHAGGCPPYPEPQIASIITLAQDICTRHSIAPQRVLAHSDIAPTRKDDPGEWFPWERLAAAGVGHLVPEAPIQGGRYLAHGDQGQPVEALQAMLALYGYGIAVTGLFDDTTQAVVRAFQRHFRRTKVDGVADASTIITLRDLIASLQT